MVRGLAGAGAAGWARVEVCTTVGQTRKPYNVSAAEVAMRRVLSCEGPDAKMEIYLREAVATGRGVQNVKFEKPITGAYSLDLTAAGKVP
jgi:hypothetical protein